MAFAVPMPSQHAGVADALRACYDIGNVPADMARLIARLR